ncbi:hypothetical protein [Mycolicibacterium tusciae]|uniref:hypothetical protein n=1 Tax=Mycolicibacterium tusciae TaxID=75922 RepID=UPI00024A478F|nr:hypothetical protein [Mycolicibacterium tusciae]
MFGAICAVISALILGISADDTVRRRPRGDGPWLAGVRSVHSAVRATLGAAARVGKAAFRRTNQVLALMWALVFALIAVLGYVAVAAPSTVHWTKAVIPVVVIVGAIGMTQIYPDQAREQTKPRT